MLFAPFGTARIIGLSARRVYANILFISFVPLDCDESRVKVRNSYTVQCTAGRSCICVCVQRRAIRRIDSKKHFARIWTLSRYLFGRCRMPIVNLMEKRFTWILDRNNLFNIGFDTDMNVLRVRVRMRVLCYADDGDGNNENWLPLPPAAAANEPGS